MTSRNIVPGGAEQRVPHGPQMPQMPMMPTPMDHAGLQAMPDPVAMQQMAQQMGPAGTYMMNAMNMMGQMLMTVQGMAGMMTALQMQQQKIKAMQRAPGQMIVNISQHPDSAPPKWDYLSPKSRLSPNSPPPYRIQNGSQW